MKLGIGWLLIICGLVAKLCAPVAMRKYITRAGTCRRGTKYVRLGIIVSLVVAVGGSIWLVLLMQPELARLKQYEILHPSAINLFAERALLAMLVLPSATLYVKACSISKHLWKWLLLVLIVLGPVGIYLIYPSSFGLIMLFLGLVWLVSGGATLCLYIPQTPSLIP